MSCIQLMETIANYSLKDLSYLLASIATAFYRIFYFNSNMQKLLLRPNIATTGYCILYLSTHQANRNLDSMDLSTATVKNDPNLLTFSIEVLPNEQIQNESNQNWNFEYRSWPVPCRNTSDNIGCWILCYSMDESTTLLESLLLGCGSNGSPMALHFLSDLAPYAVHSQSRSSFKGM